MTKFRQKWAADLGAELSGNQGIPKIMAIALGLATATQFLL
jgi:hypothetical protein